MKARRYEVSFRAELTDREVDEVADTLFELGWDDISFRPLEALSEPTLCSNCGWDASFHPPEVTMCLRCGTALPPFPSESVRAEHYSRADSTRDRDALRAADQHDIQARLKW